MFETVRADIKANTAAYKDYFLLKRICYVVFTQQLYAIMFYRLGHWAEYDCKVWGLAFFFRFLYFFLRKISNMFFGIDMRPQSDIGPGLWFPQFGGIFVEGRIGKNCTIQQDVTIGHIGGFRGGGVPTIGDNVYIGAGAKILGEVKIGNNVKIGANAVVITDIPDNALAVGVPAQVKWPKKGVNTTEDSE
jgi:serine O-acetyltransferase